MEKTTNRSRTEAMLRKTWEGQTEFKVAKPIVIRSPEDVEKAKFDHKTFYDIEEAIAYFLESCEALEKLND